MLLYSSKLGQAALANAIIDALVKHFRDGPGTGFKPIQEIVQKHYSEIRQFPKLISLLMFHVVFLCNRILPPRSDELAALVHSDGNFAADLAI